MNTGVLTSESLSQVLRSISQRRRHGVLEVRYSHGPLRIIFVQGKIIDVVEHGKNPIQELIHRLKDAQLITEDFRSKAPNYSELYSQLRQPPFHISEEVFRSALRHLILGHLYTLDVHTGAIFDFHSQMVEYDANFMANISVGQLLLDLVALESDRPRFNTLFADNPIIAVERSLESGGTSDDKLICSLSREGILFSDLVRRSLLSIFPLQETLLGLYDKRIITLKSAKQNTSLAEDSFLDQSLLDRLDQGEEEANDRVLAKLDSLEQALAATLEASCLAEEMSSSISAESKTSVKGQADSAQARRSPVSAMKQVSNKILHSDFSPMFMRFLLLSSSIVIPYLFWQNLFQAFMGG